MFSKDLYGKELIAFGTGMIGKAVIPSLARDPMIRLIGVTNSRIGPADEGTFMETGLPLRSVQSWAKAAPGATILMTALNPIQLSEISAVCREAGFQESIPISSCIDDPFRAAAPVNLLVGDPMVRLIGLANEIHETHMASFSEFKACHRGQTVAVVGAGPTLNYYSQVKGVPHIGVNGSFRREQLRLDYYFLYHYSGGFCEELKKYSFVKFFAHGDDVIPECAVEENNARRFFISHLGRRLDANIEYNPLVGGFFTIIFPALQFALYTRPKRILLVGCDCANIGHFDDDIVKYVGSVSLWLEGYRCIKKFVALHYPDTEIISVNPIGLKGMFRDVYTESYLDAHPEVSKLESITLLSELENGDLSK